MQTTRRTMSAAWINLSTRNWIDARYRIARLRDTVDADGNDADELRRLEAAFVRTFGVDA